jgi:LPXTG-site transpeptidase (sortase) family protein
MRRRGKHRHPDRVPRLAILAAVVLGVMTSAGPTGTLASTASPGAGRGPRAVDPAGRVVYGPGGLGAAPGTAGKGSKTAAWTPPRLPDMGRGWRVVIPAIGVDSPIVDLGLNPDGTLEVPTNYQVAGWYSLGPKPGQIGPVVIAGHIDSKRGPAVFYRLDELKPGDKVKVDMGKSIVTFVVTSIAQYPKDAFPTDKVYGLVTYPALRLITCGGLFDSTTGHYQDNVVVFAKQS